MQNSNNEWHRFQDLDPDDGMPILTICKEDFDEVDSFAVKVGVYYHSYENGKDFLFDDDDDVVEDIILYNDGSAEHPYYNLMWRCLDCPIFTELDKTEL